MRRKQPALTPAFHLRLNSHTRNFSENRHFAHRIRYCGKIVANTRTKCLIAIRGPLCSESFPPPRLAVFSRVLCSSPPSQSRFRLPNHRQVRRNAEVPHAPMAHFGHHRDKLVAGGRK